MKRIVGVWMALIFCCGIFAQTAKTTQSAQTKTPQGTQTTKSTPVTQPATVQTPKVPVDTIVRLGGKKIPCKVVNVGSSTILYSEPDKTQSLAIDRKEVEKIIYKTGRVEPFNKPVLTMIEEGQWEAILVTKNESDVQGLYNRGVITSKSSPSSKSKKEALKSATIKLQKKAANLQGSYILITKTEFYGGYDDNPGYELQAIVYGKEPLETGTDVIKDKAKETPKK